MPSPQLTSRQIGGFWLPLAGAWLMMAVEGPFLAAVIARMPGAPENLAAYGVAFAFALIIEAPVIMLMSAATALVSDSGSYRVLRRFAYGLSAVLTVGMVIIVLPPVFDGLARSLLQFPEEVASLAHGALLWLLPWPGAIGYRRFKQGLLIRHGLTRRVAHGTVLRLGAMALTAIVASRWTLLSGAHVGALALSAGVVAEAIVAGRMARRVVRELAGRPAASGAARLSLRQTIDFYIPLAMTSILAMGVQPMVTFFMGQSRFALESLAVLPVINGLTFIFRSLGLSFQEVGIALVGDRLEQYRPLRNFALALAILTSVALGAIAYSGLAHVWFHDLSGLSTPLTRFAVPPIRILVVLPALSVLLSFQRALLVSVRRTAVITWATAAEVVGIAGLLWIGIVRVEAAGAMAAAVAIVVGRLCGTLWLIPPCWQAIRSAVRD